MRKKKIIKEPEVIKKKLLLKTHLPPGDICTLSSAIYSLHTQYPGMYETDVDVIHPAIFEHNPHITKFDKPDLTLEMEYDIINRCNQVSYPFLYGYVHFLADKLNIKLDLQCNKPILYLSDEEKQWVSQVHEITGSPMPYWIIVNGGKHDYTTKVYPFYQEIVDKLLGKVLFVQIGKSSDYLHRPLRNVINLIDKTDLRQLIRLVYHSAGGVGSVTLLQHLCAAFDKPYMCLNGGREPTTWISNYPKQLTFSTFGVLDCCKNTACWKSKVEGNENRCLKPITIGLNWYSQCLCLIQPDWVCQQIQLHI